MAVAAEFALWKSRCCAVARRLRVRVMWPLFGRFYGLLEGHLMEELFVLGDTEFFRRWSYCFLRVTGGRVALRLPDWSSV